MFASRLRHLRQSRELTQVQLAERLGVTKQSISNWENDNIMPSVDMLERIADFFEVSTDDLLGRQASSMNGVLMLDVTGLTPRQAEHIRALVEDIRDRNL